MSTHDHHDFLSANEAHFDASALEFDARPQAHTLAKRVCAAILATYPSLLDEQTTALMDFACGSGLVSRQLCAHVRSVVGVDISQNMVDLYNLRANQQGLSPEEMHAVKATLTGVEGELDGAKFDVVVCAASYHHFPSIASTTRVLSAFLKPGGSLLVFDILNEASPDPSKPELLDAFKHIVVHKSGFTEAEMRATFEGAGLGGFEFVPAVAEATLHGSEVKFFLAKGVKQQA